MTNKHGDETYKQLLVKEHENHIEALKDLPSGLMRNEMSL